MSLGFQFQSVASVSDPLIDATGISYAQLGLLIGLYFLPGVVLAIPGGMLGRRWGDSRVVSLGLAAMTLGGLLMVTAPSFSLLVAGRLLSGIGAVLLNVIMSKMITDWFAGREIVLAMAIFVNSFPMGIGLALPSLGWLASQFGWQSALATVSLVAAAALALMALFYEGHPNDAATVSAASGPVWTIGTAEALLAALAGAIWGLYNGAFSIMFGFAPGMLLAKGWSAAQAGLVLGLASWLVVVSGQLGGLLAQRWGHAGTLMGLGVAGWSAALAATPLLPAPMLVLCGILMGLPIGVIMALPAQVLRPENRAVGMGIFFTGLYVGQAALPPLGGLAQDLLGSAVAPMMLTAAMALALLPLYVLFGFFARAWRRKLAPETA